eukprot:TRINITY_DN583_c0_g1_i2.p1 TRINITY_DN583_c0_g1~~TRINITY_DN583_c0_g1_i2.p1  ORF type:complete len:557 (-),score=137.63 TRINITY_DN583_c0_g1_i2:48-1718(-)
MTEEELDKAFAEVTITPSKVCGPPLYALPLSLSPSPFILVPETISTSPRVHAPSLVSALCVLTPSFPTPCHAQDVNTSAQDSAAAGSSSASNSAPSATATTTTTTTTAAAAAAVSTATPSTPAPASNPSASASSLSFPDTPDTLHHNPSFAADTRAAAQARDRPFEITVTHPEKHGEGMNAFVSYQVNTRTTLPQFDLPEFSVRRRFRDFEWLRTTMKAQHLGCIIPPLPEKFLVGRFTTAFIEQRRRALFKFVNRIAVHPLLHKTEEFQMFLQASDDALEKYKVQKDTRHEIVDGMFSMFKSFRRSVQASVGTATGQVPLPIDLPDDFESTKSYASDLETQLTALRKSVERLTKRRAEFAHAEQEFGQALTLMGCCESSVANLGNSLTAMGRQVESLSKLDEKQADKEIAYFEDPVKEYIGLTQSLMEMLRNCDDARHALAEATHTLDSKRSKQEQYRMTAGKEDKAEALSQEIEQAQLAVGSAKRDYASIQANIEDEIRRFHQDKVHDFRKLLHNFLNLQINHHYKVLYGWQSLIPTVESIQGDPAGTIPDEED